MKRTLVFFSILALMGAALPAAADPGQAYDQITKFQPNADLATLEPGDFATDWQTASQPAPDQPSHGGMFGKMRDAIANAQGAMGAMQNGLAETHYVASDRERIDYPSRQSGTIIDCGARTITHLDLKAKTYYVISMDQPQPPRSGGGGVRAPGPAPDGRWIQDIDHDRERGARAEAGVREHGRRLHVGHDDREHACERRRAYVRR